jgi:hypothetical protein
MHTKATPRELRYPLASTEEMIRQSDCKEAVLKGFRKKKLITQGIHWWYRPGSTNRILWNLEIMRDFLVHGDQNHPSHKKAIERYLATLPSSPDYEPVAA